MERLEGGELFEQIAARKKCLKGGGSGGSGGSGGGSVNVGQVL